VPGQAQTAGGQPLRQRGVERDVDAGQRLADRAADLGGLRGLLEAGGVQALDLADDLSAMPVS
jgi:hypothetical protein